MKRRTFLLAGSAVASAIALSGCGAQKAKNAAGNQLIVGLTYIPDIQFAPFYVAESKGLFKDAGLDLAIRHHGQQETLLGALQADNEHVVFAGGDEMMQARSQGADVINFATMYQQYPVVLIVPQASGIKQLSDLKGHSVGLPGPFGENWYGLLAMLQKANLSQSDVKIQHIGYTQQAALQSNQVDSVIGFINNDVVRFNNAGLPVNTIGLGEDATLVGVGLGAKSATIANRGEELAKMVSCLRESMKIINSDLEATVEITTKYVSSLSTAEAKDQAVKILAETMKLYADPAKAGSQNDKAWQKMADFMAKTKLVDKKVVANEAYTKEIIEKI